MAARQRRHNAVTYPAAPSFLYCWTVVASHTQTSSGHQTSPAGGSRFCIVCITDGHKNSHRHVKGAVQVRSDPPAQQLSPAVPFNCYTHPPSPERPAELHSLLHLFTLGPYLPEWLIKSRFPSLCQFHNLKKKRKLQKLKVLVEDEHEPTAQDQSRCSKGSPKVMEEQTKSWKNELVHVLVWLDST